MALRNASAFTLLETMLVVAIVAILATLLAPSLLRVRELRLDARCLSNLRVHGAIFAQYVQDHREVFPLLADRGATSSVLRCESRQIALEVLYLDVADRWHIAMADGYYGGDVFSEVFSSRARPGPAGLKTWVVYPYSYYALPEYWNLTTRRPLPIQLGPTNNSAVVFPSQKTLVLSQDPYPELDALRGAFPQPAVFVDGHGGIMDHRRFTVPGPVEQGATGVYTWRPPGFPTTRLFYTENGVRGRDVK